MNSLTLLTVTGVLTFLSGAAGRLWLAPAQGGGPVVDTTPAVPAREAALLTASVPFPSLAAVRSAPPARQEEAQVLWADGVPLAEIPQTVGTLDPGREYAALQVLLCRWAAADPRAALAAWRSLPIPTLRNRMVESPGMGNGSSGESPATAMGRAILAVWSRADPAAAAAWALEARGKPEWSGPGEYLLRVVIDAHPDNVAGRIAADPLAEGERALAGPGSSERTQTLRRVLRAMMDKDPEAGVAWMATWPGELRQRLAGDLAWPLAHAPAAIRARVNGEWLLSQSEDAVGKFTAELRPSEPDMWREDPANFGARFGSTATALQEWMLSDPAASRDWLAAVPNPAVHAVLSGFAASVVREQDGIAAAAAMLNALPADHQQDALLPFVSEWARADARGAADWVAGIDDESSRDECLSAVSVRASRTDPVWALNRSSQIEDPGRRAAVQELILGDVDAPAAVRAEWQGMQGSR